MNERKALTYLSIILAVDIALWSVIVPRSWLILIDIGVLLVCILISKIEYWFNNSHHKWIDWVYYFFSKNEKSYKVFNKKIYYNIKSKTDAEYETESSLLVTKADNFEYIGKYQWEQDADIDFRLKYADKYSYSLHEECNWTRVKIKPKNPVSRKKDLNIGFELKNLQINNLIRHSFLSYHVIDKLKYLELRAGVEKDLNPTSTAEFVVQNIYGCVISREEVPYNTEEKAFIKPVYCPRKGRTYFLRWSYETK